MTRLRNAIATVFFLLAFAMVFPGQVLADTYSVSITATQFIPSTLNVSVGDTIRFINTTTATQSAKTADTDGFNTGNIGPGENKSVVVSNSGTFTYTSQYSSALSGTVIVAGTSTTTSTSTTSATTSQPATTQEQPVSGVFEVFLAIVAAGFGFIALGAATRKFAPASQTVEPTVDIPTISVQITNDQSSEHHE